MSCEECKIMKGHCKKLGKEKVPKQKWKVMEKQDQPWKKQRLEDVSELGLVQPQGMSDWAKLFKGIMDAIKSLKVMVKVQNQHLYQQNLLLNNLSQLKAEEVYGEEFSEDLKGIPDVEMEEVVGLVDEWMEVVKAGKNVKLGSSGESLEKDEKGKEGGGKRVGCRR